MIVPTTYGVALALAILALLCWGSWANTFKLAGKWRFELFYYDYSLGIVLAAVVAAFTLGSLGNELSFSDNFLIAGRLKMAAGFASGLLVNLAGFLILAAVSVGGLSVGFPLAFGVGVAVATVWGVSSGSPGSARLWIGVLLVIAAVFLDALAWIFDAPSRKSIFVEDPPPPQRGVRAPVRAKANRPSGTRAVLLGVAGGILMGTFFPLAAWAREGDNGLGPYSLALLLSLGVFTSTFIYNIYFLNLPVQGPALGMAQYFTGTRKQHVLGLLGGIVWCAGLLAMLTEQSAPQRAQPGHILSFGLVQAVPLLAAAWGIFAWREFHGAGTAVKGMLAAMFLLFAAGVLLIGMAG